MSASPEPDIAVMAAMPLADQLRFTELLTRVGCHVYSGMVDPDGSYSELYTGPGSELFIGGPVPSDIDPDLAWNARVHPDDLDTYRSAGTFDDAQMTHLEYRMIGLDGLTRWVLDQMWLRTVLPDGRRIVDGVVTDITSRKLAELSLTELAHHDSLTGLTNRLRLGESIDRAAQRVALVLLDIDGFKTVNDGFGHATGDELLLAVARRLQACVRPGDTAARLGGDEFAILLEGATAGEAATVAQRVLVALGTPFALTRCTVSISASIGVILADHERSSRDLLRDADVAMYRAKADGKNRIVFFEPAMQERVLMQMQTESELRASLLAGDFVLDYQPLVDLADGRPVGVEALVRWQHPQRGRLAPGEFIGLAESTGLIVDLGRWVIEQACWDAALWQSSTGHFRISVNLSPRQLYDDGLVPHVEATLDRSGLPAEALVVEVTENIFMSDAELAIERLTALRELGLRIAIDDFGTGFSSLAYLDRYPVDVLKIDRCFVAPLGSNPRSAALARSIVDLASALDVVAVAEGVEVAEQAAVLSSLGCRFAQGFHFARPAPAERISALLGR